MEGQVGMMLSVVMLLPLLGAVTVFFLKDSLCWLSTIFIGMAAGLMTYYAGFIFNAADAGITFALPYMTVNDCVIYLSFKADFIAMFMAGMVLSVSFLVHLYSIRYFQEKGGSRFLGLISLLTFFMLFLVFSDNLITLYFGWVSVSLASCFSIAFRCRKNNASFSGMKSFTMNRVGDVFFLLSLIMLFITAKSVYLQNIFDALPTLGTEYLEAAAFLMLIGVLARTAQIGFHTWLPDSVIAPTPASALIHSVTMVASGIYVVIRVFPLFEAAPLALDVMVWIGMVSAIYGALLAMVQVNMKRIIAYSTVSQMGVMLVFLGMSQPMPAFLYLLGHGLYRSLMFLAAGSVTKGLSREKDIYSMGGLIHLMPVTYVFMLVSVLALNSFPFIAGTYAEEHMLTQASDNALVFYGMLACIFLTACYSFRMLLKVFHFENRSPEAVSLRITEGRFLMLAAMAGLVVLLVVLSVFCRNWFVFGEEYTGIHVITAGLVLLGLVFTFLYEKRFSGRLKFISAFVKDRRDFEELYVFLFHRPAKALGRFLWLRIDMGVLSRIDRLYKGLMIQRRAVLVLACLLFVFLGVVLMVFYVIGGAN